MRPPKDDLEPTINSNLLSHFLMGFTKSLLRTHMKSRWYVDVTQKLYGKILNGFFKSSFL
jgi:hypothetical protein